MLDGQIDAMVSGSDDILMRDGWVNRRGVVGRGKAGWEGGYWVNVFLGYPFW